MKSKIFCLEGEWDKNYSSRKSVMPSLNLLERVEDIPVIHRSVATTSEFFHHLNRSVSYPSYDLLYLAFHGEKDTLWFPNESSIELAELLEKAPRAFIDRYVLIGACGVFKKKEAIEEFKKQGGAKLVIGYRKNIDFFESSLLDMACLQACAFLTKPSAIKSKIEREHPYLVEKTGLIFA